MNSLFKLKTAVKIIYIFIVSAGTVCFFQNCSNSNSINLSQPNEIQTLSTGPIYFYKSETTGGGDLGFEIQDSGSSYTVQLNHYNFTSYQQNEKTFNVSKTSPVNLRSEGEEDLINLMLGACDFVITPTPVCEGCSTGSWNVTTVIQSPNDSPVNIYGHNSCRRNVDERKIVNLIVNKLIL